MIFGQNFKILDIVKLRLLFCHCAKLEELLPTLADIYFLFNKLSGSEKARSLVKFQQATFLIQLMSLAAHTVILLDRTFKKWALSSFAFQSF